MADRIRVLYLGLPLGALALLRDGHDVALACISRPKMGGMRRLRRAMAEQGRLVLGRPDLQSAAVLELIASVRPELVVSWFWTSRIPVEVISLAPHAFGVHPSMLPKHRGADPYFWALAKRDGETGVTAHVLSPRYDEGAILAQTRLVVPAGCNSLALARALDRPSLALMRETTARYARGEVPEAIAQDDAHASDAPSPSDDDCELLWDWTVDEVIARIRAAAPEPGAFTGYADDTIVITAARRAKNVPDTDLEPGDIVLCDEGVLVCAADGAIIVSEARREGDEQVFRGFGVAELFAGIPSV